MDFMRTRKGVELARYYWFDGWTLGCFHYLASKTNPRFDVYSYGNK
jgi:hypothetical protein